MITYFDGFYSVALCRLEPETIFVFGDNLVGVGKGGQAIIRDEPNAFGVPTKRLPQNNAGAYFEEGCESDLAAVEVALNDLEALHKIGRRIVIPTTAEGTISLGLGLAELNIRAPSIYAHICRRIGSF